MEIFIWRKERKEKREEIERERERERDKGLWEVVIESTFYCEVREVGREIIHLKE